MSQTVQRYVVYRTAASGSEGVGTVVNVVLWDGVSAWSPGTGYAVLVDPSGQYQIGQTVTLPAST